MQDKKVPSLPSQAGVYLFKNGEGQVIYIGKAKSIKHRVGQYFQKRGRDWKIDALISEMTDVDYILTQNETEALLLEAQLIQKHKPKFNVLLKEGQPFVYLMFTKEELPQLHVVRNKKDKGVYFGPFLHKGHARAVFRFLKETFKLNTCNKKIDQGCLDYHIGLCAGNCMKNFDPSEYLVRVHLAMDALKDNQEEFIKTVKAHIAQYNVDFMFEKSKRFHQYLENLDVIFETLRTKFKENKYSNQEFAALTTSRVPKGNESNVQLQEFLQLTGPVSTIDCFDISHFQSRYIVGSCVRFTNGIPDKNKFRRFRVRTLQTQDDYAALREIVARRYKDPAQLPDLILIDGGKGQLNAVKDLVDGATVISLAKREETIYAPAYPEGIKLDIQHPVAQLLIAVRDYAHHFAISYHRLRRAKELKDDNHES